MSDLVDRFRNTLAATIATEKPAVIAVAQTPWWDYDKDPPGGSWWWAVEHNGHAAFYLRALMAGDFAPGRLPDSRHVRPLDHQGVEPVTCGTCGKVPQAVDLRVIERSTGNRAALDPFIAGRAPWPKPTDPKRCWLCNDGPGNTHARAVGQDVKACPRCARHLSKGR